MIDVMKVLKVAAMLPLWAGALGGTWGLCWLAVMHWNINQPAWAVVPAFIVVAAGSQALCMAVADVFGDRKKSRAASCQD